VLRVLEHLKYEPLAARWERAAAFYRRHAPGEFPRLMLTPAQVREVAARGHDVGAHTISHPILKELAPAEARAEITGSSAWIAHATGQSPRSCAYPNGRPGRDYDDSHAAMAREAGFELAVSTRLACAGARSDIYQLPRYAPWDVLSPLFPLRLARLCLGPA